MECLVRLTPVVVAVVVRMVHRLDMVVVELEDSFKDSPKTIPVGVHPVTVGSGAAAQNPNAGAGADGIVIIRYQ